MGLSLVLMPRPLASAQPSFGTTVLSGAAWFGGQGVNVYSNGTPATETHDYTAPAVGMKWQCVELAQRFYQSQGWHEGRFAGVGIAANIYTNASSLGMTKQVNGQVSGIAPGDMVIHDTINGGAGHVAIVDSISGSTVHVVEQNGSSTGRATYTLAGKTLTRAGLANVSGIVHDPDNSNTANSMSDGTFVAIDGQSTVYRIVGGAPIRLTNWGAIPGCCGNVTRVSQSKFDSLRAYPRDGAIISIHEANGQGIYRFIGGAPIRLYNWGVVDGCCGSVVTINFGSLQALDHMRAYPHDGAMMSIAEANGDGIYTFAGGAPLRLYDWGIIPGSGTAKEVNFKSLQQLDHMVPLPKNGTFIAAKENGVVYRMASGAPLRLYDQASVPGFAGTVVWVNQKTIDQHDHMNVNPSNGTVLKGVPSGQFWAITDGERSLATSQSNAIVVNDQTIQDFPLQ